MAEVHEVSSHYAGGYSNGAGKQKVLMDPITGLTAESSDTKNPALSNVKILDYKLLRVAVTAIDPQGDSEVFTVPTGWILHVVDAWWIASSASSADTASIQVKKGSTAVTDVISIAPSPGDRDIVGAAEADPDVTFVAGDSIRVTTSTNAVDTLMEDGVLYILVGIESTG